LGDDDYFFAILALSLDKLGAGGKRKCARFDPFGKLRASGKLKAGGKRTRFWAEVSGRKRNGE
jgi:hypothetical protein